MRCCCICYVLTLLYRSIDRIDTIDWVIYIDWLNVIIRTLSAFSARLSSFRNLYGVHIAKQYTLYNAKYTPNKRQINGCIAYQIKTPYNTPHKNAR